MFLVPAKEVVVGDCILVHAEANRRIVERITTDDGQLYFWSAKGLLGTYEPAEEVLIIRRGTTRSSDHDQDNAELRKLCEAFLVYLQIDSDDDGSTQFLMEMSGVAHQLAKKLEEIYCSGNNPCSPSGNRRGE